MPALFCRGGPGPPFCPVGSGHTLACLVRWQPRLSPAAAAAGAGGEDGAEADIPPGRPVGGGEGFGGAQGGLSLSGTAGADPPPSAPSRGGWRRAEMRCLALPYGAAGMAAGTVCPACGAAGERTPRPGRGGGTVGWRQLSGLGMVPGSPCQPVSGLPPGPCQAEAPAPAPGLALRGDLVPPRGPPPLAPPSSAGLTDTGCSPVGSAAARARTGLTQRRAATASTWRRGLRAGPTTGRGLEGLAGPPRRGPRATWDGEAAVAGQGCLREELRLPQPSRPRRPSPATPLPSP